MTKYFWCIKTLLIVAVWFLYSCHNPNSPTETPIIVGSHGVYILCEGLWNYDNSTLSRFDDSTQLVINNFFEKENIGLRIGDTGNDMILKGDTIYIAVTTSKSIEIMRASTGQWLGRMIFSTLQPRNLTIVNDTLGLVSAYSKFVDENAVIAFNLKTFQQLRTISVGTAPEGIASAKNHIFTAISGYGEINFNFPKVKPNTVNVIDIATWQEVASLPSGTNVIKVIFSQDGKSIFAAYNNYPTKKPDSLAGIIEYDVVSLKMVREWRFPELYDFAFSKTSDTLYFLSKMGIDAIPMNQTLQAPPKTIFINPKAQVAIGEQEHWSALGVNPMDGNIWIANARNYQINGEVIVIQTSGILVRRFDVGINPKRFAFF